MGSDSTNQNATAAAGVAKSTKKRIQEAVNAESSSSDSRACSKYTNEELTVQDTNTQVDEHVLEMIAEAYHKVWYQQRVSDGWSYGAKRDDIEKRNPCMVRYEQLPDSEKELLRNNAKLAYLIMKNKGYLKEDDATELFKLTWQEWRYLMASPEEAGCKFEYALHHIDSMSDKEAGNFLNGSSCMVNTLKKIGLYGPDKNLIISASTSINKSSCFGTERFEFTAIDSGTLKRYLKIWINKINLKNTVAIIDFSKITNDYLAFNIFSLLDALEYLIGQDNGEIITKIDFEEILVNSKENKRSIGMLVKLSYFSASGNDLPPRITAYNEFWPFSKNEKLERDNNRTGMREFLQRLARSGVLLVARKSDTKMRIADVSKLKNQTQIENVELPEADFYKCNDVHDNNVIFKIFIPYEQYISAFEAKDKVRVADVRKYKIKENIMKQIFKEIDLNTKNELFQGEALFDEANAINILIVDNKLKNQSNTALNHSHFDIKVKTDTPYTKDFCFDNITAIILHVSNEGAYDFYKKIPDGIKIILSSTNTLNECSTDFYSNDFPFDGTRMKLPKVGLPNWNAYVSALEENGALYKLLGIKK